MAGATERLAGKLATAMHDEAFVDRLRERGMSERDLERLYDMAANIGILSSFDHGATIDINDDAQMVTVTFDPRAIPDRKSTTYRDFVRLCHEIAGEQGCGIRFVERAAV